ncbi:MAG: HAMP domain-containing protein [Blastochloris viridis]|uniref:histidine kinase n=1 Tax=Blastochloris viridis TaxID=1079 RepID=A0A6N4RDY8_BLAVI|nr:MAG: HAMP domain-containing protein [Blastochloris viridis]
MSARKETKAKERKPVKTAKKAAPKAVRAAPPRAEVVVVEAKPEPVREVVKPAARAERAQAEALYEPLGHDETIAAVWPVVGDRRKPRRGHHPVFRYLRYGFVGLIGILLIVLFGILLLANSWPSLSGPAYLALININIIGLVLLLLYVVRRVVVMMLDRRGRLRGSRLHWRVLGMFVFLAVLPAVGTGGTAIYLLNQGIESWFATKVSVALEGGRQVAEGYLKESGRSLQADTVAMSRDPQWQLPALLLSQETVGGWLRQQMYVKQLEELAVVDSEGQVMVSGSGLKFLILPGEVIQYLQNAEFQRVNGGAVWSEVFRQADGRRVLAVAPLKAGLWLVAQKSLNNEMLARIEDTAMAYHDYANMMQEREKIRHVVTLFMLLLLGSTVTAAVWAGIRLANKIVKPVTELVHGTNRVSAGDLSVRLEPRDDGELGVLTQAFNRMTVQLASNRDLLERKNNELDERRRFIEAILTGVSAGVVAVDDEGIVRVANQSAIAMLKLTMGTKLAKAAPELADLVHDVSRGNVVGRGVVQHEMKVTVEEGDTRTLLVRLVPQAATNSSNLRGVILTFDDITPLIGAQRLAAWQDVARRLAHEIKNPLTPIQLSAERLKRRYGKQITQDTDLFMQLCDTIVQQSEEMRRMTNEFSDFARMPQAQMADENMVELVDGVVVLQRARGGVEFITDYNVAVAMVKADKGQVTRVFTNLLENAYNAIAEREGTNLPQGRVEIVAREQQAGMLTVEIRDNGRGLPENVEVESLFDPYVTTRKGGTGLGLAIVKRVMDEHGGTVRLLRRKTGGTTVELGFPLAEPAIAATT